MLAALSHHMRTQVHFSHRGEHACKKSQIALSKKSEAYNQNCRTEQAKRFHCWNCAFTDVLTTNGKYGWDCVAAHATMSRHCRNYVAS